MIIRIVTWNCNQALDQKWSRLQAIGPDIAIVQECASPEVLVSKGVKIDPEKCLWMPKSNATNANKGLGIFPRGGVIIRQAPDWEVVVSKWNDAPHRLDVLLPFEVLSPFRMNILAVWSFNNRGHSGRSKLIGPVLIALEELSDWLKDAPSIVIGDFNNHPIWDKRGKENNFRRHIDKFAKIDMFSVYHSKLNESYGSERNPTYKSSMSKYYHIDYAFICNSLLGAASCDLGVAHEWIEDNRVSDHVPLILDLAP